MNTKTSSNRSKSVLTEAAKISEIRNICVLSKSKRLVAKDFEKLSRLQAELYGKSMEICFTKSRAS